MNKLWCFFGVHEYAFQDQELVDLWQGTRDNIVARYTVRIYGCKVCGKVKQIKVKA